MSHTPGPWTVTVDTDNDGVYWVHEAVEQLGAMDLDTHEGEWMAVDAANARLIAAAPDMLDALRRITHPAADDSDLENALAVIAKATEVKQ